MMVENKEPLSNHIERMIGYGFILGFLNAAFVSIDCFAADVDEKKYHSLVSEKMWNDIDVIREKLLDIKKEIVEQFDIEIERMIEEMEARR